MVRYFVFNRDFVAIASVSLVIVLQVQSFLWFRIIYIIYPHSLIRKERKVSIGGIGTGGERENERQGSGKSGSKLHKEKVIQEEEGCLDVVFGSCEGTTIGFKGLRGGRSIVVCKLCDFGGSAEKEGD